MSAPIDRVPLTALFAILNETRVWAHAAKNLGGTRPTKPLPERSMASQPSRAASAGMVPPSRRLPLRSSTRSVGKDQIVLGAPRPERLFRGNRRWVRRPSLSTSTPWTATDDTSRREVPAGASSGRTRRSA
jgi:hypothetical protein